VRGRLYPPLEGEGFGRELPSGLSLRVEDSRTVWQGVKKGAYGLDMVEVCVTVRALRL